MLGGARSLAARGRLRVSPMEGVGMGRSRLPHARRLYSLGTRSWLHYTWTHATDSGSVFGVASLVPAGAHNRVGNLNAISRQRNL